MVKTIFVDCYLAHNLGDDLFLYTLLARYPETHFVIIADNSYSDLADQFGNVDIFVVDMPSKQNGLVAWWKSYCSFINRRSMLVHNADAMVTVGGSLYMENPRRSLRSFIGRERRFLSDKELVRQVTNREYFIIGANFGPFHSSAYLRFYKKLFAKYCRDICFRDVYSANLFSEISVVRHAPDVLFNASLPETATEKKIFISVVDLKRSDKFGELSIKTEAYDRLIAAYMKKYNKLGYEIVLCSFCQCEGDESAVQRLMQFAQSDGIKARALYYRNNMKEVLTELASSSVVLGTRFHATILGLLAGADVLPIMYSHKTKHVLEDMGFDMRNAIDLKTDEWMNAPEANLPNPIHYNVTDIVRDAAQQFAALDEYLK